MLRKIVASSALIIAFSANAFAFTLQDAIIAAHENNYQILAEAENLKATKTAKPRAWTGFLPTVTSGVTYQRTVFKYPGSFGTNPSATTQRDRQLYNLNINQPLFRGGRTYAEIKSAGHSVNSGTARYKAVSNEISLNAVNAYSAMHTQDDIYQLNVKNEKVIKEHLRLTKTRFDLGEVTRTDISQAKARLANATADKVRAAGEVVAAEAFFERIVGIKAPADIDPISLKDVVIPKNFDEFMNITMRNNPNIISAKENHGAAKSNVLVQTSVILPQVSATANLTRSDLPTTTFNSTDSDTYALNVNIPIFQSGSEYTNIVQAKHQANSAKYNYRETERQIRETAIRAWNNFKVTRSVIKSRQQTINAARKALDGVEEEAKIGTRTTLDVLDAQQELFNANVAYKVAERDHIIAVYTILQTMGAIGVVDFSDDLFQNSN